MTIHANRSDFVGFFCAVIGPNPLSAPIRKASSTCGRWRGGSVFYRYRRRVNGKVTIYDPERAR